MDDDMDDTINQNDAVTNSISSLRPGIVHRLDKGTTGKNCIQS
jgi:23S rRNA-/tRNA-specific pseudouridylate synthase